MNWCEVNIFLLGNILIHGNVTKFLFHKLRGCKDCYVSYTQECDTDNDILFNTVRSRIMFYD